jgi:hypothetical protein
MKRPARTAQDAFAAGQAAAVLHRFPGPGVTADIDIDRAIKRTNAALNATHAIGDNLPGFQSGVTRGFLTE